MACVRNKSLVLGSIAEDLSANNREYMVLGGSDGRKIISNKNEPKQFKNGKKTNLGNSNQLATVSCAKTLHVVLKTTMAAVSTAHVM